MEDLIKEIQQAMHKYNKNNEHFVSEVSITPCNTQMIGSPIRYKVVVSISSEVK